MKKFVSTIVVLLLLVVGCTDQTNITSPDQNVTLDKKPISGTGGNITGVTLFTASKEINGDLGGFIYVGDQSSAYNGEGVYAGMYFPAGSFSGTKTITITLNSDDLSGTFSPSMEFNVPVRFTAFFTGIKLRGNIGTEYEFVYQSSNGQQTIIPNSYLHVDKENGVIGIINAQISHFSRYAFVR
jgi:hypothetical protein